MGFLKTFLVKYFSSEQIQHTPYYLIALLIFNMVVVTVITVGLLYRIGFDQQKNRLIELVETQASMIEIIAQQEIRNQKKSLSSVTKDAIAQETIRKVTKANYHYGGFGKTGEFTLGLHTGDRIKFIIKQRHFNIDKPKPVPWNSKLGEPMRLALKGYKGHVVALDYRGETVLAAYQPIQSLGWGIVAKIDLAEVRAPYITAASYAMVITFILGIGGSIVFWFYVHPLVKDIEDARQFNRMLISKSSIGLALCTFEGDFVDANFAFSKIIGMQSEDMLSLNYFDLVPADYQESEKQYFQLLKYQGSINAYESIFIHKNGERIPVKVSGEVIPLEKKVYLWLSVDNIKEFKKREAELLLSDAVFNNTTEVIFITDENQKIIKANKAFTEVTGYPLDEVLGKNPRILKSGRHDKQYYKEIFDTIKQKGTWRGEIWNRRKDGALFPSLQSISALYDNTGKLIRYVSILADISTQKAYEQQLIKHSQHDFLTGLPNRQYFEQTLEQLLLRVQRTQKKFALFFIDLNQFKEINDTFGHDAGDILLKQVAERLKSNLRSGDFVARLGGDEFVIILESINNDEESIKIAENIIMKNQQPIFINGKELIPSLSIGIAFYPDHGTDISSLLKCADEAMYHAKHHTQEHYSIYAR